MPPKNLYKLTFQSVDTSPQFSGKKFKDRLSEINHPGYTIAYVDYNPTTRTGNMSVYSEMDIKTTVLFLETALGGSFKEWASTCNN